MSRQAEAEAAFQAVKASYGSEAEFYTAAKAGGVIESGGLPPMYQSGGLTMTPTGMYTPEVAEDLYPPAEQTIMQAGFPIAGVLGALGGAVPAMGGLLGTIGGIAAAGYGVLQALGLGEGGGLGGVNLLGGDESQIAGTPIDIGGAGLPEPGRGTGWNVIKEWHVNYDWGRLQYYYIQKIGSASPKTNKWIAMYNTRTKLWKAWRWKAPVLAVIGKNMPSHKQITRLRRNLSKQTMDAVTILKLVAPGRLKAPKKHYSKR